MKPPFRNRVVEACLLAGLAALLTAPLRAHGGQFRGPGDVQPSGPSGSTTGSSTSPGAGPGVGASGAAPAPSTPGPTGPATTAAGTSNKAGIGVQVGPDLGTWSFWWEFNKDPFLKLKDAVHRRVTVPHSDSFYMARGNRQDASDSLRPTAAEIDRLVLPALEQALRTSDQRDITSAAMVALAKIGRDHATFRILDVFRAHLPSRDQEIRETAALAMGISAQLDAVAPLAELLLDTDAGRLLVDRTRVDERTRAFAAYGLGLIANAQPSTEVKRHLLEHLRPVLSGEVPAGRLVLIAAINAAGLLDVHGTGPLERALLRDSLLALETYFLRDVGPAEQMIQAHVPPAVASLLRGHDDPALRARYLDLFLETLRADGDQHGGRSNFTLPQSAAIALGLLAGPNEKGSADARVSAALLDAYHDSKDHQTAYFALVALGRIGGTQNRLALLRELESGNKALQKPWAALALGVHCHLAAARHEGQAPVDDAVGRALVRELRQLKNPDSIAALAIALGLCRYTEAADELRGLLLANRHQDELAGYLCIGLALMRDRRSIEPIRGIVEASQRRPTLLTQAAVALGKLGDKQAADLLLMHLARSDQNLARIAALSAALGLIGDRRSIEPLIEMLHDESLTDLSRAFAAVALGGVADKEPLPWNSKIATNVNYRAAVETLTNQVSGILDIL